MPMYRKSFLQGADWFRTIGTEGSPGTKTFSLTGSIENTGLIEVPMGTTLRHIIYDIGGGLKSGAAFQGCSDRWTCPADV